MKIIVLLISSATALVDGKLRLGELDSRALFNENQTNTERGGEERGEDIIQCTFCTESTL